MKAALLNLAQNSPGHLLRTGDVPQPSARTGQVLLRVLACGVCRTDLHIAEGELPSLRENLIPGHQIVGEIVEGATSELPLGTRVGVSWIGGIDGTCWYCQHGLENLCDSASFTGYTVNGGYAEYAIARAVLSFLFPLRSTICTLPLSCVPASLVFAASGWLGWSTKSEWGCSVSGPRHISPSLSCARGGAKYMSRPEAPLIAGWRNRWGQPGWEARKTSRPSNWTAP